MSTLSAGGPNAAAIAERARSAGIELPAAAAEALAAHARAVLAANERLHLTSIVDPAAFLERHLGEAFEGAALLAKNVRGELLDLGSGNGYPGIPICLARPGLTPVLAEASTKKAAFLTSALDAAGLARGRVLAMRVARTADVEGLPPIAVLATRAMGGWERIVPKLVSALAPDGVVLLWAGTDVESLLARQAWTRLRIDRRASLPGRAQSIVYRLSKA